MAQRMLNGAVQVETHFAVGGTQYRVTLVEEWASGLPAASITPRGSTIFWTNADAFPPESIGSVQEVLEELVRDELAPGDGINYQLKILYGTTHPH